MPNATSPVVPVVVRPAIGGLLSVVVAVTVGVRGFFSPDIEKPYERG
jgi:hypothetical protein